MKIAFDSSVIIAGTYDINDPLSNLGPWSLHVVPQKRAADWLLPLPSPLSREARA